jgi:uncharacterized protein YdeI (YjbR/CyaY-like superfamily)
MQYNEIEVFYPENPTQWRQWLQNYHTSKQSVWLVFYNKASKKPTISWSEAVDVALCFGWIDSKKVSIDKDQSYQFFSKRKAKSTWSKINKEKVERLMTNNLMSEAGLYSIEVAKANGSWTILDEVEELIIPEDLKAIFQDKPNAEIFFLGLSKSIRKAILQWLVLAKQQKTRQKRITEIVEMAAQKLKPKHLQ